MREYTWKSKKDKIYSIIIFLAIWQGLALLINNEIYLPKVMVVLRESLNVIKDSLFFVTVGATLYRTLISFILAITLATILGLLSVIFPKTKIILEPFNAIGKTIPTLVLVVLALIWFNKDVAPYIVGFAIAFPIIYEGVINSVLGIDKEIIEMAKIYEISERVKVKKIYIPTIKNYLIGILVSTFSLVFKVVVAGEVHGQPKFGIGSAVQLEKINFNTPGIFSWILIIALLSIVFEWINKILKRRINKWKS